MEHAGNKFYIKKGHAVPMPFTCTDTRPVQRQVNVKGAEKWRGTGCQLLHVAVKLRALVEKDVPQKSRVNGSDKVVWALV